MSEELLQTQPHTLGRYVYYVLGATTLSQLKRQRIIHVQIPAHLASKKPDGLIVSPNSAVKAVIEYKNPSELSSAKKRDTAINQEIEVAKSLCKLLIVTDGEQSFWINALTGEEITDRDGSKLKVFSAKKILEGDLTQEQIFELEELLDQIDFSLSEISNTIAAPSLLDPSPLAKAIWQTIWINTGKEPEKCLYNVVELFVFKFLSDVGVLKSHNNFDSVYSVKRSASDRDALKHYAHTCRRDIRELFPKGEDGTTIINGTIFVNEKGEPNMAQARLFGEVLDHLQAYAEKYGSFRHIQREFKTRLYESFLRQEAGVRFLGQFFTPRNVVRAIVEMSPAKDLKQGARICDPFCGVGGFLMETIADNPHIYQEFEPKNGIVNPRITLVGYDKGTDEKEDERTIILAKANMLIYFSDLLSKYNSREHLKAFSQGAFNRVFTLLRSNLGTFAKIDDEPFDLILTNPPYVTSGSYSLKRAVEEEGLASHYTSGGRGTESLALEWIVRHLVEGGHAFVVVPDGLLNQSAMLDFLKKRCIIRAIVSLPARTFYSTPKKTYILVLKHKRKSENSQLEPVFTYLVSEIGETRDAKRFKILQNDLVEATALYSQFNASPTHFQQTSSRCKLVPFAEFSAKSHWLVERWWTEQERLELGLADETSEASEEEFHGTIAELQAHLSSLSVGAKLHTSTGRFLEVYLSDERYFQLAIGKRVLLKNRAEAGIPVYSANVTVPFGYIEKSNITDFSRPSLLWGIDGNFDWGFIPENKPFASTDHCGVLYVINSEILPKYVYYELRATKNQYGFDRTYRANLANIKEAVRIRVPIDREGNFDLDAQQQIVQRYESLDRTRNVILDKLEELARMQVVVDLYQSE